MQDLKSRIEEWLVSVNVTRATYWNANYNHRDYEPLVAIIGRKYMKILDGSSVWGFVALEDGINKGAIVQAGDLLKPADWRTPAKLSRGNVLIGTDSWTYYGPAYLK